MAETKTTKKTTKKASAVENAPVVEEEVKVVGETVKEEKTVEEQPLTIEEKVVEALENIDTNLNITDEKPADINPDELKMSDDIAEVIEDVKTLNDNKSAVDEKIAAAKTADEIKAVVEEEIKKVEQITQKAQKAIDKRTAYHNFTYTWNGIDYYNTDF